MTEMGAKNLSLATVAVIFIIMGVSAFADFVVLTPTDDLWITSLSPTENRNEYDLFRAGWDSASNAGINRGMLKFDLSGIPTGANITSVTLHMYLSAIYNISGNVVDIYRASGTGTDTWSEVTACWNTQTGWTLSVAETDSVNLIAAGSYDWDMTASMFSPGETVTLVVRAPDYETGTVDNENRYYNRADFRSKEYLDGSDSPKLTVTYTIPEPATTGKKIKELSLMVNQEKTKLTHIRGERGRLPLGVPLTTAIAVVNPTLRLCELLPYRQLVQSLAVSLSRYVCEQLRPFWRTSQAMQAFMRQP